MNPCSRMTLPRLGRDSLNRRLASQTENIERSVNIAVMDTTTMNTHPNRLE